MKPIVDSLINGISAEEFIRNEGGNRLLNTKHENLQLIAGHLDVSDLDAQISLSLKIASEYLLREIYQVIYLRFFNL